MIESKLSKYPISHCMVHMIDQGDRLVRVRSATRDTPIRILDSGEGWLLIRDNWVPVTFYVEDILYRLDLQGKLP